MVDSRAPVADLIEWAASQSWSTGAVGMLGVSYLAITQWRAAACQTRRPGTCTLH